MVKKTVLTLLIFISFACHAQEKSRFVNKGLLRSMATFSTGYMHEGARNLYVIGELEYYTSENISIRSNVNYFVNRLGDNKPLKLNHQVFTGALYHVKTNGHFDPFVGFLPGVSFTQILHFCDLYPEQCLNIDYLPPSENYNPLVSVLIGLNYYANKIFHLSATARYVYGNHLSNYRPFSLRELQFQFGLGINLWVKKPVEEK